MVDNNNYCNFEQFRNAILLIVNQCSPLYNRPVDYVEWTNRLMELLTYDAGNAMITFKSDEDITSLTLVPRTPWTDVSMISYKVKTRTLKTRNWRRKRPRSWISRTCKIELSN